MEFNDFDFGKDRIYQTGKLTHDYFYGENSINDKFRDFLNSKYNGKVECYIKPFGLFSRDGDNISSFMVQLLDHNNVFKKYINQVHVNFSKYDESSYVLGVKLQGSLKHKVSGYSEKLSKQLFNDTIEFLDSLYK
jgi:hypothetical protein